MHVCIIHNIAAEKNNNKMLETYHNGAYGSLVPDEWSCCKHKGQKQMGCRSTADDKSIPVADSVELERFRERQFSPPEPIAIPRRGVQFNSGMTLYS